MECITVSTKQLTNSFESHPAPLHGPNTVNSLLVIQEYIHA